MNEDTFLKTVAPRIGGNNAIQQLNPVQQHALIELLIEKGIITREELEVKTQKGFARLANTIMTMPIPSPVSFQKPRN